MRNLCDKCPCYTPIQSWCGECDERCDIGYYDLRFKWYCLLPKRMKKILAHILYKREERRYKKQEAKVRELTK